MLLSFMSANLIAQTTISYTQQQANYDTFFTDGGGNFNNGATEMGMWANGAGNKESVAWRNFTDDGTTSGVATTMEIGDSFTITLNYTRAYGQIGIALLASPSSKASWADRINNSQVQVNLDGNSGTWKPWEVVPSAGVTVASTIYGNDNATGPKDAVIKFTRINATQITVDIDGGTFTTTVTPTDATAITGYSVYIKDDWNGAANSNIYWKQTSSYIYENKTTWTGTFDTNWNDGVNWSGPVPTSSKDVVIPNVTNLPIVNGITGVANNLTIDSGATLTIAGASSFLTVSGNLTNNGTFTINNGGYGGSLIVNGTSSGNITHNLNVPDTNWHLVSAPVSGVTINDAWVAANSLATGTGTNMGAAGYDNSTDADGDWSYFTAGDSFTMNNGEGFSIKRSAAGNVAFTGTYTAAPVNLTTTQSSGAVGNDWNLLGNPFTSYIDIAAFITANTANFSGAYQSIYVWDNSAGGGTGAYVSKTTGYLQPGQGFFVNSDAGTSVTFTSAMQSHQSGITFYRTNPTDFAINLRMSDGTNLKSTEIVYENGKTTGLDPRFDIGSFTGENTSFNLYTELITNNSGVDFMRQSLPTSDYENMVIPVGINATAGTQLTFTADVVNIPSGHMVFLEDRANNTFTRIDESNSNYQVTLNSDSNGIGRFYIHASTQRLKVDNVALQNISVYTKNNHLIMAGLPQGNTSVSLYNILGKNILTTSFNSNGFKELTLPSLSKGVYIVQLATEKGNLNKKVIIE